MNKKNKLRDEFKLKRAKLDKKFVTEQGQKISQKIIDLGLLKKKKYVMCYSSANNEIDTKNLINFCLKKIKSVILPRIIDNEICCFCVEDANQLEVGNFKIMEPKTDVCKNFAMEEIELIIIPGLVFDKNCNRIGMGKGYYDKFLKKLLSQNPKVTIVGICYDFQVVDNFEDELEEFDIPMNIVITESNIYYKN